MKLVKRLKFWIYWLVLRSEVCFGGKKMVVAMLTKVVAMITIMVAMVMEPVATDC